MSLKVQEITFGLETIFDFSAIFIIRGCETASSIVFEVAYGHEAVGHEVAEDESVIAEDALGVTNVVDQEAKNISTLRFE